MSRRPPSDKIGGNVECLSVDFLNSPEEVARQLDTIEKMLVARRLTSLPLHMRSLTGYIVIMSFSRRTLSLPKTRPRTVVGC